MKVTIDIDPAELVSLYREMGKPEKPTKPVAAVAAGVVAAKPHPDLPPPKAKRDRRSRANPEKPPSKLAQSEAKAFAMLGERPMRSNEIVRVLQREGFKTVTVYKALENLRTRGMITSERVTGSDSALNTAVQAA